MPTPDYENEFDPQPDQNLYWLTVIAHTGRGNKHTCVLIIDDEHPVNVAINYAQTMLAFGMGWECARSSYWVYAITPYQEVLSN